jgi:hypothetical protein
MSTSVKLKRKARGERPYFFADPNVDKVIAMVMGLAPVVGSPLPLVSWGGTAMVVIMIGFGLVQSAHVHHPR